MTEPRPAYIRPSKRPFNPQRQSPYKTASHREAAERAGHIDILRRALKKALWRSKLRHAESALTMDDLRAMYEAQDGKCALTGLKFQAVPDNVHLARNPLAPSIDRIDCSLGYTVANCRLVCVIANTARADFGDDAFYAMCAAAAKLKR